MPPPDGLQGPAIRRPDGDDLPRLLGDLHELHVSGVVNELEFANAKRRLLRPADPGPRSHPGEVPVVAQVGRSGALAVAALAVGAVVLVLVPVMLIMGPAVTRPGGSAAGYTTSPPVTSSPFTSPPEAAPTAQEELDGIVAADRAGVDGLLGTWVAQLSAKRVGQAPDGTTNTEMSILSNHRAHLQLRPDVLLLRSDDYGTFRLPGFYVTIGSQPFGTGEEALSWCVSQGLGPDDCFAKRILVSGAPEGNTLYQG